MPKRTRTRPGAPTVKRVLVVEDSATQREALRRQLEGAGYEVEVAATGEEGIARFDPERFHLVISDIVMPGSVDGYGVCRHIKAGAAGRHVPVVLLTSLGDPLDIIKGLECGADDFLTKPHEAKHLLGRIEVLLATRQARAERRLQLGVDVFLLGHKFTISSDREQILDLLISTFEDAVLQNRALLQREEQLERSHQSLQGLYRIALGLNSASTEAEVAKVALERALELPGVQAGWISLREGKDGFRLVAAQGLPPALAGPAALQGDCFCRRKLLADKLDSVVNVTECERLQQAKGDTRGLRYHAAVPLWVGSQTIGILNLAGPEDGMFSDDDLQVLYGVGHQIGVALERASLQQHLEQRVDERTAALKAEVAERERTERARLQLATILEATTDLVSTADEAGRLQYLNQAGRLMVGIGSTEDISRLMLADLLPDGERDHVQQVILPTLMAEGTWSGEMAVKARDGQKIPVLSSALAHRSTPESPLLLAVIARDLTEYKKLEQQFRQAQKLEAIGRLTSGIAHDFNNVLTAITGYTDLLLADPEATPTQRTDLGEIGAAAARAGGLTRQLLAFSRQQVLEPRVLDLNAVVAGMENMLRRMIGEDVELAVSLAGDLRRTRADPSQMEQIILNLVVNARDAMPEGGKLTVETANVELDSAYAREHVVVAPGSYVLLAVSDTGVGMDAETMANIFEPFFTTKELGKGTGLGLATVYGIVKQSGGSVWVYSEPGHGATFKVYLPSVDESVADEAIATGPAHSLDGTETICVVEDNESVRRLVCTVLRGRGYTVLEAAGPAAALALIALQRAPVNLLLTDVVMPGMSGRELADRLRAGQPGLRVLFNSGYTDDAIVRHGVLEAGVAFLQKPFTPVVLLTKVRAVLDAV
ncbi:MAG: response regulator [Gemmatimonadaceae bacterium]